MRRFFKQFIPPIVNTLRWYSFKYGWKGDYTSFEEAKQKAIGYDAQAILEKIISTTKKVRDKEIAYERDGIEYDTVKMNFNLLNSLLLIASRNNGHLNVIDFGGSLGTTYFQNLPFLDGLNSLVWNIIEQPNYVAAGKEHFESTQLRFYDNIASCIKEQKPNILIFCNVLQYINDPYQLLHTVKQTGIPYLLLDFVGYSGRDTDRITIQHVPPVFYGLDASYACWFFAKEKMNNWLAQYYHKQYDFISEPDTYYIELTPFLYEGQLWKLK
ncbi:MAG: methyltransferase, TIGR04325 family [Chitinophagaceae bacterium]|nr:methyltransferase, TIGR04325 family [Chitinophagaceae bacterium]